jgi:hypothetical protein
MKAAAVMVGAATESPALELRDVLVAKMESLGSKVPSALRDWKLKLVLTAMHQQLDQRKPSMDKSLAGAFDTYWTGFIQQIRVARNDAGHPKTVDPVTPEGVQASLLMFPHVAELGQQLKDWVGKHFA